jgi:Predicted ABC-type transport system involved in lysophospholipase L1 biosynthesis, permease component
MSGFAIVLGVAFVAGSLIFTDTLGQAFTKIMSGSFGDVVVRPAGAVNDENTQSAKTLPASLVTDLVKVDGAARVDGNVTSVGVFVIGKNGKVIGAQGAPGIAVNFTDAPAGHGIVGLSITSGRAPAKAGEITLDPHTADLAGYKVGDIVPMVTSGAQPSIKATMVGIGAFGGGGLAGASLTTFDLRTAQELFQGGRDVYSDIWVTARDGVSQAELRDRVQAALPAGVEAVTGDKATDQAASAINKALSFISTFLLVFAGVSLVVGTFLIINTFSILVAQRSRELALFRALGASRRQVSRSVLFEALVIGFIGSTVGLALGFALALGIKALFAMFGLDLSGSPLVFEAHTALAAYLVGMLVTAFAAYLPGRRASRIAPIEALRDDVAMPESSIRRRALIGTAMTALGAGALGVGLFTAIHHAIVYVGGGMLLVVLGVAIASPLLGRPVVALVGVVYRRMFGTVGRLAEQNAMRNPRRTAATASALMVGLTLVSMMAVFGQSTKASIDKTVGESFSADYVVSNAIGVPFSPAVVDQVVKVPGVGAVARFRYVAAKVGGESTQVGGIEPIPFARAMKVRMDSGKVGDLSGQTLLVEQKRAQESGLAVGDKVTMSIAGKQGSYPVVGIFEGLPGIGSAYLTSLDAVSAAGVVPADNLAYVVRSPGADAATVRAGIDSVIADLPTITLKDQAEFAAEQRAPIDQMLMLIYALLGLAVVIAVLGIVNTLALSVIERTREVGLLRAVGLSRPQLRTMVRLESIVISLLGAVLGVGLGLVFGVALQRSQADSGVEVLSVPFAQLLIFVVLAALVGVLAAVWPARRAARLDVLRAITTD